VEFAFFDEEAGRTGGAHERVVADDAVEF